MDTILDFINEPIRISEGISFTLASVFVGLLLYTVLLFLIGALKRWLGKKVLTKVGLSIGARAAVTNLIGYTLLIVGTLVIMPVIFPGFSLNTLGIIIGGVSVGIGFGLRNIADNFISGLIILIESPIKVGDRVQVDDIQGDIIEIRGRSTVVKTNDNVDIIIPNSFFISREVVNLSLNDRKIRFKIPVGVHYGSDVEKVKQALLDAAVACPNVLKDPEPSIRFISFDDSSLQFEVRVWSESLSHRPKALASEVNFKIWEKFKEYGVEIPYPQRDLYIKEWPAKPKPEEGEKLNEGG